MSGSEQAVAAGILGAYFMFIFIIAIVLLVLLVIARWKLFTKAGEAGWKSIIPIYSDYVQWRIGWNKTGLFWLYILLSFLFYIPVAVGAGIVPMLGMLMLPKTVCYILMVLSFLLAVIKDKPTE